MKLKALIISTFAWILILAEAIAPANAQPLGGFLPGPALPEQVGKAIQQQEPKPMRALPPAIAPPKEVPTPVSEEAKKIKFKLNAIVLEGNHVYTTAQLRELYKNKLGKVVSVAELFEIVQNITNFYRNNGYILSRAILPPQHVKNGIVHIRIIEGYISKVDVIGHPKGAKCLVLAYGKKIIECRPLEVKRMEKYMLLANEIPSTQVKAILSPSKTVQGAADLDLATENQLVTGYLSYDNYGTRYIGPQQMSANLTLNSFITSGDIGTVTVTKTPRGNELTFIDSNYTMALNDEGVRWQLGGTRTQTHPLFILAPIQIDGLNVNYYTTLFVPITRTRTESLTFILAFNYLDTWTTIFSEQLYTDHIRSLGLGFNYLFSDDWLGSNAVYGDIRQGLPIWGWTSDTNPETAQTSRPGGRARYTKLDLVLSRLQLIKDPVYVFGILKGQWAFMPLLAAEQFAFGGSQIGRGYDVAELIGDKGAAASLELRYNYALNKVLQTMQFYLFYDAGMAWNFRQIGLTPRRQTATSGGFGVRFFFQRYVSGNFTWTQPLTKKVAAEELIGRGERSRVYLSLVAAL